MVEMQMAEEAVDPVQGMMGAGGDAAKDVKSGASGCCVMQVPLMPFSRLIVSSQHGM